MFEKTIQSPHGMGELNAVFETKSANYNENSSSSYYYTSETDEAMPNSSSDSNTSLNYEMYYWVNAQSRLDYIEDNTSDNQPLIWKDSEMNNSNFNVHGLDSSYDGLSIALKAEKHCLEVTLA